MIVHLLICTVENSAIKCFYLPSADQDLLQVDQKLDSDSMVITSAALQGIASYQSYVFAHIVIKSLSSAVMLYSTSACQSL